MVVRRCTFVGRMRFVAAALAAAVPLCVHGEPFYGADLRYAYDDNLTLASDAADRRGDSLLAAGGYLGQFFVPSRDDTVSVSAGVHATGYARFALLDETSLEASGTWRRKLGLGYAAPWIALRADASHDDYRDDIRDSDRVEIALVAGTRLSERFDVSGGISHDRRLARNAAPVVPGISGALYDVAGDSLFVRGGYAPTPKLLFDASLRARRGDVVATTPEGLTIFVASNAIAADPAFGSDRYGYRLRGTTTSASLAMSYAIDERSAVNVEFTYASTSAAAGLDYRESIVSASWVLRY
ncbi:MAG TPA: hypothetical protein VF304_04460 [Casimicrobiaceae bacterium]